MLLGCERSASAASRLHSASLMPLVSKRLTRSVEVLKSMFLSAWERPALRHREERTGMSATQRAGACGRSRVCHLFSGAVRNEDTTEGNLVLLTLLEVTSESDQDEVVGDDWF